MRIETCNRGGSLVRIAAVATAAALCLLLTVAIRPALALDGIAFERSNDLWLASPNGGSQQLFYPTMLYPPRTFRLSDPQISPNGQYVVATSNCTNCFDGFDQVMILNNRGECSKAADRGNVQRKYQDARWHPLKPHSYIAATAEYGDAAGFDLMAVNWSLVDQGNGVFCPSLTGAPGEISYVATWPGDQRHPTYSPDGGSVAFDSTASPSGAIFSDGPHIFITTGAGGSAVDLGAGSSPSFSADGQYIIYERPPKRGASTQIYRMTRTGGSVTRLATSSATDSRPQYTSDGLRIIFRRCTTTCAVWSMNANGTSAASLITNAGLASGRQAGLGQTTGDLIAAEFRPILKFDEGEQWRPLDVDRYLTERSPGFDTPMHQVCDIGSCTDVTSSTSLAQKNTTDSFLQSGVLDDPIAPGNQVYRSPNPACVETVGLTEVKDCNSGPATAVYYNATIRSAGYNYIDWWWYYRFNDTPLDEFDHAGDWEGLTIAPSADGTTFDWVGFAQHERVVAYLHDNVECEDGGPGSCGVAGERRGRRVTVYVAAGTHASYPYACAEACAQNGAFLPETDHGGDRSWGRNYDDSAYRRVPGANSGQWVDWRGRWGSTGTPPGADAPGSPGTQERFKCPWAANFGDATACTSRTRRLTAGELARHCGTWVGAGVAALACDRGRLRHALRHEALGRRGRMAIRGSSGRRAASAPGLAQVAGRPLRPHESLRFTGLTDGVSIAVRASYRGARYLLSFTADAGSARLRFRTRGQQLRAVIRNGETTRVVPMREERDLSP